MHAGPKTKGGECSVLFLKACSDLDNLSVGVNIVLNPFLEQKAETAMLSESIILELIITAV